MHTITNRYPGTCSTCKNRVPADAGVTAKVGGRWIVWCSKHDPNAPKTVSLSLPEVTEVEVAETESGKLLAHQAQVVAAVRNGTRSLYIADEPGLGKTAQALVSLVAAGSKRAVVVVPAVVKTNWAREVELWTPGREVVVLEGRKSATIPASASIVVINYDILTAHLDNLLAWRPDALVVDEAHYVKERTSARTKAVAAIAECVGDGLKIYLSGTPIPNRPIELVAPLTHLGLLDSLGGFWGYAKRYAGAFQDKYGWDMSGATHLEELHEKLLSCGMVRRKKSEVTDLPERSVVDLPVALTGDGARSVKTAQRDLTKRLVDAVKAQAKEDGVTLKRIDFDLVRRVVGRELSGEAGFGEISLLRKLLGLAKVDLVVAQAESLLQSGPAVVFAHHREVVARIADALTTSGHRVGMILGGQKSDERQAVIDGFQRGDLDVVVASIDASGVGVTLHRASQVVLGELPWTAAGQDQAIDRVHRIGQDEPVTAWRVLASDTLDRKLADTVAAKARIATVAIDGEAVSAEDAKSLTDLIAELVARAMKVSVPTAETVEAEAA